jgi:hypothetical protein
LSLKPTDMETPPLPTPTSVDEEMLAEIKGMQPWLRFFSILGFILTAMFIFVAIFGAAILAQGAKSQSLGLITPIAAFIFYGGVAWFMLFTSLKLFWAADRAGEIQSDPSREKLIEFLRLNRKFWKAVGIFYVAAIALYIVLGGIVLILELLKKAR